MSRRLRFISLTPDQQLIVNDAYQHGAKRALRRRAHAILLSHKGHSINQIRNILGVKRHTVSTWLSQWEKDGIEGLQDKPREGRPHLLNESELAVLQQLVEEHSHQLPVLHAVIFNPVVQMAALKQPFFYYARFPALSLG